MNKPVVFTTSGTVQADEGTYLKRRADDQLLRLCQRGEYAYILTARQMGKSSLMMATSEQLRRQGIQTVVVDFQRIGAQTATASQWYLGILMRLARQLRIAPELMQWWEAHQYLGEVQRLVQFFEEVLLAHIQGRVVVFFDEIDSTLGLDFTDDFFIALRYCYTARAENPAFKRLSFVLLGVATPSELIADSNRTPFNIGTLVELTDFNEAEAMPLAAGLGLPQEMARNVLRWILQWTDGHPYLTQSACQEVVRQGGSTWTEAAVKQLIHRLFFGERREQDRNLQFVQKTLIGRAPGGDVVGVLSTYREVRCGRGAVYDEDQSLVKAHLKLSGVVKRVGSRLEVRNPIYRRVFDWRWIQAQEEWPEISWWERIKPAMPLIAGLSAVVVLTGGSLVFAVGQRNNAVEARNDAVEARNEAEQERDNALAAQQAAEEERNRADQERQRAEAEEKRAESRRAEAEAANQLAEERRQQAVLAQQAEVEQRQRAEVGEQEANENAARAQRNADEASAQRSIAQDQALNSGIDTRSLTIENALSLQRNTQAFWSAMELGRDIQALDNQTNSQTVALNKHLPSGKELPPGTVNSSSRLQAASVLDKIYYLEGYLERQTLRGHESAVYSVSFSHDGQTIASASLDGTVKLWDVGGRERQTLRGHESAVWSVSFSPDGQTIASASSDGTIILWDFNLESLLDKSCEWWRDYLTYGNATDEEKALCPHIPPSQPLHATLWHWGRNLLGMATHTP